LIRSEYPIMTVAGSTVMPGSSWEKSYRRREGLDTSRARKEKPGATHAAPGQTQT
jgi:hypothetical protein